MGGFLGSIGKAIGGAVSGFLGTGSPWGAVVGGVGGLLGGGGGGGGGGGDGHIGTYIPPTTMEAYNIVKGLEGQVGDITKRQYDIQKPYLDEALNVFRNEPNTILNLFDQTRNATLNNYGALYNNVNNLFNSTENSIKGRYSDLYNVVASQLDNQWSKSALGLSALGMYNTPATQLTQSDIVNQLYGRVAEKEADSLVGLDTDRLSSLSNILGTEASNIYNLDTSQTNALLNYYNSAPNTLLSFSDSYAQIDPDLNKFKTQLGLAQVLQGLSADVLAYPKTTPLEQASKQLNDYIRNNSKNLPDFGKTMGNIFGGVKDTLGSIFNSGGGGDWSEEIYSEGWEDFGF
jgi:hypothetical protein